MKNMKLIAFTLIALGSISGRINGMNKCRKDETQVYVNGIKACFSEDCSLETVFKIRPINGSEELSLQVFQKPNQKNESFETNCTWVFVMRISSTFSG